jgi:CRP-like cAMP-binding protein
MDLGATLEVLRQIPYFRSLPALELRSLAANLRTGRYQADDVIFRRGDPSQGLCVVVSGRVQTVTASPEGREQVLKVFGPGRTFADIAVFDDEPQPADAIAVIDSLIAFVPRATLLDLLTHHPNMAIDVIRLFASRLRAYKQVVEDLSLRPVNRTIGDGFAKLAVIKRAFKGRSSLGAQRAAFGRWASRLVFLDWVERRAPGLLGGLLDRPYEKWLNMIRRADVRLKGAVEDDPVPGHLIEVLEEMSGSELEPLVDELRKLPQRESPNLEDR